MQRPSGRRVDQLRAVKITRDYTRHAEGSVLIEFGDTKVLCTASIEKGVPRFLRGQNRGWLTAEYGMLPRSTNTRMAREAARGKQGGRTVEIQRLIGRSLRAGLDLSKLGEYTVLIDCDVLQADGGTRCASISGASVALADAIGKMRDKKQLKTDPLTGLVAAVSVGVYQDEPVLDLDYAEDSVADTDMNIVMLEEQGFIEVQGSAEGAPFGDAHLHSMLELAKRGLADLHKVQKMALAQKVHS